MSLKQMSVRSADRRFAMTTVIRGYHKGPSQSRREVSGESVKHMLNFTQRSVGTDYRSTLLCNHNQTETQRIRNLEHLFIFIWCGSSKDSHCEWWRVSTGQVIRSITVIIWGSCVLRNGPHGGDAVPVDGPGCKTDVFSVYSLLHKIPPKLMCPSKGPRLITTDARGGFHFSGEVGTPRPPPRGNEDEAEEG